MTERIPLSGTEWYIGASPPLMYIRALDVMVSKSDSSGETILTAAIVANGSLDAER